VGGRARHLSTRDEDQEREKRESMVGHRCVGCGKKGRERKRREGKGREGKGREGKGREGRTEVDGEVSSK